MRKEKFEPVSFLYEFLVFFGNILFQFHAEEVGYSRSDAKKVS